MKAIMVMYDSLNRRMLENYDCNWIETPNFKRLAEKAVTFDRNYVGSLPCMPARRELHTGRINFNHRGWGPLEPFDDSMPEILSNNKIFSYLSTDHAHYWEDGGATYHQRYSGFDFNRGQEGDKWKTDAKLMKSYWAEEDRNVKEYDRVNRNFIDEESKMPQAKTFEAGLEFIEYNHDAEDWFLQIETFDPHEPFFSQPKYKEKFKSNYKGPVKDWPPYYFVTEDEDTVSYVRNEYAALITMCDDYLGKVLDMMDKYNMWEDTMLIVNTDHGYLLGEHNWWSKNIMPTYEEIARTPLFIYNPKSKVRGERRDSLTQTIDLPVTILDFFDIEIPKDMEGKSLLPVIEDNSKIRDYAMFGYNNSYINITDGEWVYMKAPLPNTESYEYTLMPTRMNRRFHTKEFKGVEFVDEFDFTKGCMTLKVKSHEVMNNPLNFGTKLFNLTIDPKQEKTIDNIDKEVELANELVKLMKLNDAPKERYERFGFPYNKEVTKEDVINSKNKEQNDRMPSELSHFEWKQSALNMYEVISKYKNIDEEIINSNLSKIDTKFMYEIIEKYIDEKDKELVKYMATLASRTY